MATRCTISSANGRLEGAILDIKIITHRRICREGQVASRDAMQVFDRLSLINPTPQAIEVVLTGAMGLNRWSNIFLTPPISTWHFISPIMECHLDTVGAITLLLSVRLRSLQVWKTCRRLVMRKKQEM